MKLIISMFNTRAMRLLLLLLVSAYISPTLAVGDSSGERDFLDFLRAFQTVTESSPTEVKAVVSEYLNFQIKQLSGTDEHSNRIIGKVIDDIVYSHSKLIWESDLKILLLHFLYANHYYEKGTWRNAFLHEIFYPSMEKNKDNGPTLDRFNSKGKINYVNCLAEKRAHYYTVKILSDVKQVNLEKTGAVKEIADKLRLSFVAFARDFEYLRANRWKCLLRAIQDQDIGFHFRNKDIGGEISDKYFNLEKMSSETYIDKVRQTLEEVMPRLTESELRKNDVDETIMTQNNIAHLLSHILVFTSAEETLTEAYKEQSLRGFSNLDPSSKAREFANDFHQCFNAAEMTKYVDQFKSKKIKKASKNALILAIAADKSEVSFTVFDCYYKVAENIPTEYSSLINFDFINAVESILTKCKEGKSRWEGFWTNADTDRYKHDFKEYERMVLNLEIRPRLSFS